MANATRTKAPTRASRAAAAEDRQAKTEKELAKIRERQAELSAKLNPDAMVERAELDGEFIENWQAEQRMTYPHIYREADKRLEEGGEPSAAPSFEIPRTLANATARVGLEPGHDPNVQNRYADYATTGDGEEAAASAGADNIPPHETTPAIPGSTAHPTGEEPPTP